MLLRQMNYFSAFPKSDYIEDKVYEMRVYKLRGEYSIVWIFDRRWNRSRIDRTWNLIDICGTILKQVMARVCVRSDGYPEDDNTRIDVSEAHDKGGRERTEEYLEEERPVVDIGVTHGLKHTRMLR